MAQKVQKSANDIKSRGYKPGEIKPYVRMYIFQYIIYKMIWITQWTRKKI